MSNNIFQLGENGDFECDWSNDLKEIICQLNFQLVRTNNFVEEEKLSVKMRNLLSLLFNGLKLKDTKLNAMYYLEILYKLTAYTRDIIDGKGGKES